MFSHQNHTAYATPKTVIKGTTHKKYTMPEIPEGIAPYWQYGQDVDSGLASTICVLVKSDGTHNNKLPSTLTQWETVAVGIAFQKEGDADNPELARVISLGRALKVYNKSLTIAPKTNWIPINTGTITFSAR